MNIFSGCLSIRLIKLSSTVSLLTCHVIELTAQYCYLAKYYRYPKSNSTQGPKESWVDFLLPCQFFQEAKQYCERSSTAAEGLCWKVSNESFHFSRLCLLISRSCEFYHYSRRYVGNTQHAEAAVCWAQCECAWAPTIKWTSQDQMR